MQIKFHFKWKLKFLTCGYFYDFGERLMDRDGLARHLKKKKKTFGVVTIPR